MELILTGGDGRVVCRRCRLADNPVARARGLLGRTMLDPDEGLFIATGSIHTFFMRFPIDAVFVDRENVVLSVVADLKPWRIVMRPRAHGVIELPAGTCDREGVRVGDRLSFGQLTGTGNGDASRALRVAVASEDGRFLRVAGFLLNRQGFEVESLRDPSAAARLGQRHDVVVIDGSESLSNAARVVRLLAVESPATGVVVVSERGDGAESHATLQAMEIVPKWESFDRIVGAVSEAAARGRDADG